MGSSGARLQGCAWKQKHSKYKAYLARTCEQGIHTGNYVQLYMAERQHDTAGLTYASTLMHSKSIAESSTNISRVIVCTIFVSGSSFHVRLMGRQPYSLLKAPSGAVS